MPEAGVALGAPPAALLLTGAVGQGMPAPPPQAANPQSPQPMKRLKTVSVLFMHWACFVNFYLKEIVVLTLFGLPKAAIAFLSSLDKRNSKIFKAAR